MAVGRCVLHLVAVPQLITSQLAFQSSRRCPQSADPPATHHENCFASWKWVNNSIIKNENSSSVASWLHKSLECWNRSESARLQGISEGKSTINRRLDGNEMIMMPSAFGKECTNILFALKGCCILERCVCRFLMRSGYYFVLKKDKPRLHRGRYTYMCTYGTRSNKPTTSAYITARWIIAPHEILYIRCGQDTHWHQSVRVCVWVWIDAHAHACAKTILCPLRVLSSVHASYFSTSLQIWLQTAMNSSQESWTITNKWNRRVASPSKAKR